MLLSLLRAQPTLLLVLIHYSSSTQVLHLQFLSCAHNRACGCPCGPSVENPTEHCELLFFTSSFWDFLQRINYLVRANN